MISVLTTRHTTTEASVSATIYAAKADGTNGLY